MGGGPGVRPVATGSEAVDDRCDGKRCGGNAGSKAQRTELEKAHPRPAYPCCSPLTPAPPGDGGAGGGWPGILTRVRRSFAVLLAATLAIGVLAGAILGPVAHPSLAGTVTTATPPTSGAFGFFFQAVSCVPGGCVAVGEKNVPVHRNLPAAARLIGGVWRPEALPQPARTRMRVSALNAVSCWSARGCVTVGAFWPSSYQERAFAEVWSRSRWQLQRHVGPLAYGLYELNGVSCPTARACIAVGDAATGAPNGPSGVTRSLVERWDGGRWRREPSPNPGPRPLSSAWNTALNAVSCADPEHCVAIGSYSPSWNRSRLLAETYAGGRWSISAPPTPQGARSSELNAISCPTPTECVAVGAAFGHARPGVAPARVRPLAELWSGHGWSVQPIPAPSPERSSLSGVSCPSPSSCTAVGASSGRSPVLFAEHWNGHRWRRQPTLAALTPGGVSVLNVFCSTSRTCLTVYEPGTAGLRVVRSRR